MCSVLLNVRRMCESMPVWTRVRGFLITFGLSILFYGVTISEVGRAQDASQSTGTEGTTQTSAPNGEPQTPAATGNGAEETAPNSNAEGAVQASAPNDESQAPAATGNGTGGTAQGARATTSPTQNGATQPPTQGSRPQATGARATPAQRTAETHQSEPQEIQQPSPYGNLPSLQDLYTQIPSGGGGLQRFGSDAFLLGTGNANELPMDLPVGPDYVLGPGDSLVVNMWGGQSSRLERIIDRQGQIELPEAGAIMISGLTIAASTKCHPTSPQHAVSK